MAGKIDPGVLPPIAPVHCVTGNMLSGRSHIHLVLDYIEGRGNTYAKRGPDGVWCVSHFSDPESLHVRFSSASLLAWFKGVQFHAAYSGRGDLEIVVSDARLAWREVGERSPQDPWSEFVRLFCEHYAVE